jgi:hypothetical protein
LSRALADEERYDEALERIERLLQLAEAEDDDAMYDRARRAAREIIPVKVKNK